MYLKTQGLVLRETNYKEADKLLTVLTRDYGKRTVKARACRRKTSKLTGSAQLLVYSELTLFEHRERYTLHEASAL
ncbi:MAG: repair protein RecO, partial [Evtepia sp.]|nr:repair protein RecO [Evtepia sp.]